MDTLAAKERILYRSSSDPNGERLVDFQYALFNPDTGDKGLWVPVRKPTPPGEIYRDMAKMTYAESAFHTLRPWFTEDEVSSSDLRRMTEETYYWNIPIQRVGDNYVADHGVCPSLSFKDGGTFGNTMFVIHFTPKGYIVICLDSTSGDTGPSNAMGLYRKLIDVFTFFPIEDITGFQRRQISTLGENVYAIGIRSDFDGCQNLRDYLMIDFANDPKTKNIRTITGNSKSIGRFLSMLTFWDHLSSRLAYETGADKVNVFPSVGNGSHFTSALYSREVGAPIGMVCPISDVNMVIPKYLETGIYKIMKSIKTDSTAINIGNPKNAARFAELFGGIIDTDGNVIVEPDMERILEGMRSTWVTQDEADKAMIYCHEQGFDACPHGSVAEAGMEKLLATHEELMVYPRMFTNTAHPVKFPNVSERVLGIKPELPDEYKDIYDREERLRVMEPDVKEAKEFIMDTIGI